MKIKGKLILSSIVFVTFFVLKMAYQVLSLPDFGHGKAYVDYSSDGEYKVLKIYPTSVDQKKGVHWGPVLVLVKKTIRDIVYIYEVPYSYTKFGGPIHNIFLGNETKELNDDYYTFDTSSNKYNISLHPSLWTKIHIWLVVRWYDIDLNNLTVEMRGKPFKCGGFRAW